MVAFPNLKELLETNSLTSKYEFDLIFGLKSYVQLFSLKRSTFAELLPAAKFQADEASQRFFSIVQFNRNLVGALIITSTVSIASETQSVR
jgi:hypothetical protein